MKPNRSIYQETLEDSQLAIGIGRCIDNANDYLCEAELLSRNKHFRRACALAILGIEELGKVMLLGNTVSFSVRDFEDWKNFWKQFITHETKQANGIFYTLFYIQQKSGSKGLKQAMNSVNFNDPEHSLLDIQNLKNDCFYVGFDQDKKELLRRSISKEVVSHYIEILRRGLKEFSVLTNFTACKEILKNARKFGKLKVTDTRAIHSQNEVWNFLNLPLHKSDETKYP